MSLWRAIVRSITFSNFVQRKFTKKLPSAQKAGIRAPANVKIDGKTNEWLDKFEVCNTNNALSYTLANDDENIYFVFHTDDTHVIEKILAGGVTVTVSRLVMPSKSLPVSLTFPVMATADRVPIYHEIADRETNIDKQLPILNKQLIACSKEIGVSGIKEVTDTLLSRYNDQSIKAAALFDSDRGYTCELSLPIKYITMRLVEATFKYDVILNGAKLSGFSVTINGGQADPNSAKVAALLGQMSNGGGNGSFQFLTTPSNFSGKYKLAKNK